MLHVSIQSAIINPIDNHPIIKFTQTNPNILIEHPHIDKDRHLLILHIRRQPQQAAEANQHANKLIILLDVHESLCQDLHPEIRAQILSQWVSVVGEFVLAGELGHIQSDCQYLYTVDAGG